jgi:hypothetical protein
VLPTVRRRGRLHLQIGLSVLCVAAVPLIAQTPPLAPPALAPDAQPAETVRVGLSGFTFAPALDEAGQPVLDDAGQPVILRVPLDDSLLTPGEAVLYVLTLDNPTPDPALDLILHAQVAAEVMLDPFSLTAPAGLVVEWADAEAPDSFRPLFEVIEGEAVLQADLDTLRALRLTLPELPPESQVGIEYTVTLR